MQAKHESHSLAVLGRPLLALAMCTSFLLCVPQAIAQGSGSVPATERTRGALIQAGSFSDAVQQRSRKALEEAAQAAPSALPALPDSADLRSRTRAALEEASKHPAQSAIPNFSLQPGKAANSQVLEPERLASQFMAPSLGTVGPMVFVSLSMPQASLQRLAQDARRVGGVLVLRGAVNNSLRDTVTALQTYGRLGVDIAIHPEAFKRHSIKVVPSFVVDLDPDKPLCSESSCRSASPVIEGDVTLAYALQRIERSTVGSVREQTSTWLSLLQVATPTQGVVR